MTIEEYERITIAGISFPVKTVNISATREPPPSRVDRTVGPYRFNVTLTLPEYDAFVAFAHTLPQDPEAA